MNVKIKKDLLTNLKSRIGIMFAQNFKLDFKEDRVKSINEYDAISYYENCEINREAVLNLIESHPDYKKIYDQILKPNYLYKKILSYEEIYISASYELQSYEVPRLILISHQRGIRLIDLAVAFYDYVPLDDYGDHRFYEGIEYIGDYENTPVYKILLGS